MKKKIKKPKFLKKGFRAHLPDVSAWNNLEEPKVAASAHFVVLFSVALCFGLLFFAVNENERLSAQVPELTPVKTPFERNIEKMVSGYPIESMVSEIAKKDPVVAAYMVSIAKKESNWGKRSPKLDGKDCYNYWGFREERDRMGTGGHTCFESRYDAVNTVSKRIKRLVYEYDRETPREMVVWKCGYSCDGHSEKSVEKWIADVGYYYRKFEENTKNQERL